MNRSHYLGVLLGAAIGDALGAPVEFSLLEAIRAKRGPEGVTDLEPRGGHPAGSYTDDTQMTIATAQGTLAAFRAGVFGSSAEAAPFVWDAYLAWRETQDDLAHRRGPGSTCLSALGGGVMGTPDAPLNGSKGCGTIMRIAPCALLYPDNPFDWALACGAMTHGHPTGYLAGAAFAQVVHQVLHGGELEDAIADAHRAVLDLGPDGAEVGDMLRRVLAMQVDGIPLPTRIVTIGEGWVAEETLGIVLSCALAHPDDFLAAVRAAVNITGDSDSTGSVTGALMGAMRGSEAMPAAWREQVESADLLVQLGNELFDARLEVARKVEFTDPDQRVSAG